MKKFLLFIIVIVFVFCTFSKANAINDRIRGQNFYKDEGNWKCNVNNLNPLPYWSSKIGKEGGDFSIETVNPLCTAFGASYALATVSVFNLGPSSIGGGVALATLLASTGGIYAFAIDKFNVVQICGTNWLVWGYPENLEPDPIENYPIRGSFKGSYKYYVENCIKDKEKCKEERR